MDLLLSSNLYLDFIHDRDKALEGIHWNAQKDLSKILFEALSKVRTQALEIASKPFHSPIAPSYLFEHMTLDSFSQVLYPMVDRIIRMRKSVYTLTYWGEIEAIGRGANKTQPNSGSFAKAFAEHSQDDTTLRDAVWLSLMKLRDRLASNFRLSLVKKLPPNEIVASLEKAFPEVFSFKRPPKALKKKPKLKEADQDSQDPDDTELPYSTYNLFDKDQVAFGFTNAPEWQQALDDYMATELPASRFDNEIIEEIGWYNWELEKEITNEFVSIVRDGEFDAGRDMGIEDFVWIAILDEKTDECCASRDGMTTSEIEAALDSGKLDPELCEAVVPPAHFNCRCRLAPIEKVNQVEGPDWKSFNEWIES